MEQVPTPGQKRLNRVKKVQKRRRKIEVVGILREHQDLKNHFPALFGPGGIR